MAISGRKAVRKQEFLLGGAFGLTLRIRPFFIADDGLPRPLPATLAPRSA